MVTEEQNTNMKKISINKTQLRELIQESIGNSLSEQSFTVEPHVPEQPRETSLRDLFGRYSPEVPEDTFRYMRKNPRLILRRLMEIYGDKFFEMVEDEKSKWLRSQAPLDESKIMEQMDDDMTQEQEERQDIKNYMKELLPVVRGDEEFDRMHEIEIEYLVNPGWRKRKRFYGASVIVEGKIPDTGYPDFDKRVIEEYINYLLKDKGFNDVIVKDIKFY